MKISKMVYIRKMATQQIYFSFVYEIFQEYSKNIRKNYVYFGVFWNMEYFGLL